MSLLSQFLTNLRAFIRDQDGDSLHAWLQVSPNSSQQYFSLGAELRAQFGAGPGRGAAKNKKGNEALEAAVEAGLPEEDDVGEGQGTSWPGFVTFVKDYMVFWRDVDFDDLVKAHSLLCGLVNSCSTAFANPSYGGMLLKTSMSLSEVLVQLTMMLNRRPDLTSRLGAGDEESRKSVAETSAEIIQKIFTTCLTDRASARMSRPEGKKVGVYMFANLVLKLLFACRKTHLAKQIFTNISTNSPPLSLYPAAQRVTFLYYLGRFNLSNNHFLRAANCLSEAYLQTHSHFTTHRTLILTYLIPANLLLGILPSEALLARPECAPLIPVYAPLRQALRKGDFYLFQQTLSAHESWLFEKGILLLLTHRLRPTLWRSLSRRVFLLTYTPPTDPNSRRAPLLDLSHLLTAATYIHRRMEGYTPSPPSNSSTTLLSPASHNNSGPTTTTLSPPPGGPKKLRPNEGMVWGNAEPTMQDVELAVAALVQQGLLHGYVAHDMGKFAVMGAKTKGAVAAGWPAVATAVRERRYAEEIELDAVPGWVTG